MKTKNKELDINLPHRYKRKSSALHKVWNYMRWNRTFRYGDVLIVTGVSRKYLTRILWHLKAIGYVKVVKNAKPYNSTQFTLIKCTGVKSPSISNGVVYDYNIAKEFKVIIISPLNRLLNSMNKTKMSKQGIAKDANVGFTVAKRWFVEFAMYGIIKAIIPVEKIDGQKAFTIDLEKVLSIKNDTLHEIHKKR